MRFRSMVSVFAIALIQAVTPFASADTIVDVGPNNAGGDNSGGTSFRLGGANSQVEMMSWTQSGSYTGVSISALVGSLSGSSQTFEAYLSKAVGSSATSADLIDSAPESAPGVTSGSNIGLVTLFSNETLAAGTYYLTLFSSDTSNTPNVRWAVGTAVNTGTVNSGGFANSLPSNGTPNTTSPWESTFVSSSSLLGFNVTGTAATTNTTVIPVPEPSTFALMCLSGIGLMIRAHRRRTSAV